VYFFHFLYVLFRDHRLLHLIEHHHQKLQKKKQSSFHLDHKKDVTYVGLQLDYDVQKEHCHLDDQMAQRNAPKKL
jgi:hypothetical protein